MKDIVIRAGKTFIEAAFAYISLEMAGGFDITSETAVKGLLISAVAAGFSAVINLALKAVNDGKEGIAG